MAAESEKILSDAWDFNGRPAVRFKTGGWAAAAMILGNLLYSSVSEPVTFSITTEWYWLIFFRGGAEREADHAGDSGEPGHIHHWHDAPGQCHCCQHRYQLHGDIVHALPLRRIHCRHIHRQVLEIYWSICPVPDNLLQLQYAYRSSSVFSGILRLLYLLQFKLL